MGSSFSPSAANLFMASLEEHLIPNPDQNPFYEFIFFFVRFTEDIFCIYTDIETIQPFVDWLNNVNSSIRFTYENNKTSVNFLDTTVYVTPQQTLATKPLIKSTDMNSYLHFSSFHLRHLHVNIPFGQFLRLKRNSTSSGDFLIHSKRMSQQFINRGYPLGIVKAVVDKSESRERTTLFTRNRISQQPRIHWALDYTPRTKEVESVIKRHWHLLKDIPACKDFPAVGYRRTGSLKELLTRTSTTQEQKHLPSEEITDVDSVLYVL